MVYRLEEIVDRVGGEVVGEPDLEIHGVAKIEEAQQGEITFIANSKYLKFLDTTRASAVIVPEEVVKSRKTSLIRSKNPYYTFLRVVSLFYPPKLLQEKGIHPTVVWGEGTVLGKDLSIGPYVVIGKGCHIGDGTMIMPGVVIADNVKIGLKCTLHANVCICEGVILGNRVILNCGVVLGSEGFGFASEGGKYHKIPQVGTVVIEDDVEIGANTTVDRATLGETRIKRGVKLDNLIQVGHNCSVDEDTVIAAQAGLSGSTHIGSRVLIGGQAGFAGHLHVGDGAAVGAQAGVAKSIPSGVMVSGYPARPHREELRLEAALHRLPRLLKEVKALKERLRKLEEELKR